MNNLKALDVSTLTQTNQSEKMWWQYNYIDKNKWVTTSVNNSNVY
jgi:hypothetical protein